MATKADHQEADCTVGDHEPIFRTDRQRRIVEWRLNNCPECSRYLREFLTSVESGTPHVHGHGEADMPVQADGTAPVTPPATHECGGEDFDVFASSPLFRGLPLPDLNRIYAQGEKLELESGSTAIEEGKINTGLYVVLSGELQVSLPAGPGRYGEVVLAKRKPPDCFGEYAFIDYKMASASVTATLKSRLFKIGFEILDNFIDSDPELARSIYENVLLLLISRLRAEDAELDVFRHA